MIFRPKSKWILIVLSALIITGVALMFLRGSEDAWIKDANGKWQMHGNPAIHDFKSCAEKYPVIETFPEQCTMPDGPTFMKSIDIIT